MLDSLIKQVSLGAVAIGILVATPAMAHSKHKPIHYHTAELRQDDAGRTAFGSALRQHSPNPAWDVYGESGEYIGSDPDWRVREQLRWEYTN